MVGAKLKEKALALLAGRASTAELTDDRVGTPEPVKLVETRTVYAL
jgi:hypothetical protein